MKLVDLTHLISEGMPVYPGTEQPVFNIVGRVETDGFFEKKINFYSHTGTHMDAPAHMLSRGKHLDRFPIDHFQGKALVLNPGPAPGRALEAGIGPELLIPYQDRIETVDFLLIHTGWDRYWGRDTYYKGYPVLTPDAARWLAGFGLKGVGVDTISVDREKSRDFPVHKALLEKDILIIENLKSLGSLPKRIIGFSCFPLNLKDADGAPVRAVAYLD